MTISAPRQTAYYYECSHGNFRLVYFIPPEELNRFVQQGTIDDAVLDDFPDGVDLDCTEPDFKEFDRLYGYRPVITPEALLQAFSKVLSSTADWENFRGTGFIPAADLEAVVETVQAKLQRMPDRMDEPDPLPDEPSLRQRRVRLHQKAMQQQQLDTALREIELEMIEPGQPLNKQEFSPMDMEGEESAEEVFSRLQYKQR